MSEGGSASNRGRRRSRAYCECNVPQVSSSSVFRTWLWVSTSRRLFPAPNRRATQSSSATSLCGTTILRADRRSVMELIGAVPAPGQCARLHRSRDCATTRALTCRATGPTSKSTAIASAASFHKHLHDFLVTYHFHLKIPQSFNELIQVFRLKVTRVQTDPLLAQSPVDPFSDLGRYR